MSTQALSKAPKARGTPKGTYLQACRTRRLYAVWLREQGKTLNEIANVMRCSRQRVHAMLKQEAL